MPSSPFCFLWDGSVVGTGESVQMGFNLVAIWAVFVDCVFDCLMGKPGEFLMQVFHFIGFESVDPDAVLGSF